MNGFYLEVAAVVPVLSGASREELEELGSAMAKEIDKNRNNIKALIGASMSFENTGIEVINDKLEFTKVNVNGERVSRDIISTATTESAGIMSAEDKKKIDNVPNAIKDAISEEAKATDEKIKKEQTRAETVEQALANGIANAPNLALRALFLAAGAEYNDTDQIIQKTAPWGTEEKWRLEDDGTYTYWEEPAVVEHLPGHYYLNGLGDITEEEMITIYIETFPLSRIPNWINAFRGAKSRTNIFPNRFYASQIVKDISASFYNYTTDVICLNAGNYNISTILDKQVAHTFYECSVKHVVGVIDFINTLASAYGEKCKNLIDFKMKNIRLGNHKTFGTSPNISKRSVLYLIQNASPTTAITVTLHPNAYARIANQPDIIEALEAQPLITLVSA